MTARSEHPSSAVAVASRLADELDHQLAASDRALEERFPGARPGRQPVHTVYVPADRYTSDLEVRWGEEAGAAIDRHQDLFVELTSDLTGDHATDHTTEQTDTSAPDTSVLLSRERAKLGLEPIEDLRIDFEDGYGARSDDVEDQDVMTSAAALAEAQRNATAAPFRGIRFKSFELPTRRRGVRTLTLFVHQLLESGGNLDGFAVTLPKVTSVEQVEAMVRVCGTLERSLDLSELALRFEIQVETPQSIIGPDGTALVAKMVHASGGRCTALHYGTYDYSAFCGIAAEYQAMDHPAADLAKLVMQAAAAGTGVRLSDGSTNILPVGDQSAVRRGWAEHLRLIQRSLRFGYYQGWDLHPAQLPTRFAATYGFYRAGFGSAALRLKNYVRRTASTILDEPATARAMADFIVRGFECGALSAAEVTDGTTLPMEELAAMARPTR